MTCDVFPPPNLQIWLAGTQKFIVEAYPIDGHICTVMNPIQWRDKGRGLWEVPGQCGPIQHVSIVLNTIDMTGCRHNSLEILHVSRGLLSLTSPSPVVAFRQTPYLFHLFKCQRIVGFHWPEGWEGVQEAVDVANLDKSIIPIPVTQINQRNYTSSLAALKSPIIIPFSGSQSHRQTWELVVAWGQREYLWTIEKRWHINHIIDMYKCNQDSHLSGWQVHQWYLLNDISDGQQLLCGVSCLRQRGIIIITSHYWAEPRVMISTYKEINGTTSSALISNSHLIQNWWYWLCKPMTLPFQ